MEKTDNEVPLYTYSGVSFSDIVQHRGTCKVKLYRDRLEIYSLIKLKATIYYKEIVDVEQGFFKGIIIYTSKAEYKIHSFFSRNSMYNNLKDLISNC